MRLPTLLGSLSSGRLRSGYGRRDRLTRIDTGRSRDLREFSAAKREVRQSDQRMRLATTKSCFETVDRRRRVVAREAEQGFAQQPAHAVGRVGTLAKKLGSIGIEVVDS